MGGATVSRVSAKQVHPEQKRLTQLDAITDGVAPKIEKVSSDDKKEIIQLRMIRKLTQEDLNKRMNLPKDTIKRIENGTHEKNKSLTNRIKEYLSSRSKNPYKLL
jgi:DNA-binding XRE family transcriptional regulator